MSLEGAGKLHLFNQSHACSFIKQLDGTAMLKAGVDAVVLLPPKEKRRCEAWRNMRLLISPDAGKWRIVGNSTAEFLRYVSLPRTWDNVRQRYGEQIAVAAAAELWTNGMLSICGKSLRVERSTEVGDAEPNFIALHVSQGCNMRCSYCYNGSQGQALLSASDALAVLEKAGSELKSDTISVDFLGGEPLLAWPSLVEIMNGARRLERRLHKKFKFMMQTNGLLLTPEIIGVLLKNNVGVGVSLDGPALIHDVCRRTVRGETTHERVVGNLRLARQMGLDVNPLAVISSPESFTDVLEYFVCELGLRTMRFNILSSLGRARSCRAIEYSPLDYCRGFLKMTERALQLAVSLNTKLCIFDLCWYIRNLLTDARPYMCRRSPCGLGRSIVACAADGFLYACEEYEDATKAAMRLGRLSEVDLGRLRDTSPFWRGRQPRTVENVPRCSRCLWRRFCGGGCAHKALAYFGDWYREDPMCAFYERLFPELMWKIVEDKRYVQYLA